MQNPDDLADEAIRNKETTSIVSESGEKDPRVNSEATKVMANSSNEQVIDREAFNLYKLADFNRNGILDVFELQSALNYCGLHFSQSTVNILLAKHDRNRNGQIEFEEFKTLLDEVWMWIDAFEYFDSDKSGAIDFEELQKALVSIGIHLSPTTFQTVFFSADTNRSGTIQIDEFIKLVTELQLSQVKYSELDKDRRGKVEISYDSLVDLLFSLRSFLVC